MPKYTSHKATFVGGTYYPPGSEFELDEGVRPGKDMVRVIGDVKPAQVAAPVTGGTLRELQKSIEGKSVKGNVPAAPQKAAGGEEPPLA